MISEDQPVLFKLLSLKASSRLLVRMTLQLVELNTVQFLKPLLAELTGEVVVRLWSVFLHVPVQGCTLATLVATNLTLERCFSCVSPSVNFKVILALK